MIETRERLTKRQLGILQHSLGLDEHGRGETYRNHFCAGGDDEGECRKLVAMGYMETFERSYLPYYNCLVTESGKTAVSEQSPKPPKLTRGQRRYRRYLRAETGESFKVFLKTDRDVRRRKIMTDARERLLRAIDAKLERMRVLGQKKIGEITEAEVEEHKKLTSEIVEDMNRAWGPSRDPV